VEFRCHSLFSHSSVLQLPSQCIAAVSECSYGGPEVGWRLTVDPEVPCNENRAMFFTVAAAALVVGAGLPAAVFWYTRRLQASGRLTADSPFFPFSSPYRAAVPWFEAAQLSRKGLLILATTGQSADNWMIHVTPFNSSLLVLLVGARARAKRARRRWWYQGDGKTGQGVGSLQGHERFERNDGSACFALINSTNSAFALASLVCFARR
jgi:hypothetical protein